MPPVAENNVLQWPRWLDMADVMLRVPAILVLDVLMSGLWLIPFASHIQNEFDMTQNTTGPTLVLFSDVPDVYYPNLTFYGALFSSELVCWKLWSMMAWNMYILLSTFYYIGMLMCIGYIVCDTYQLLALVEWFGPFALAIAVVNWGLVDVANGLHESTSTDFSIVNQKNVVLAGTRLATRLAFAIVGSNVFIKAREENIRSLGGIGSLNSLMIRFSFHGPFLVCFKYCAYPMLASTFRLPDPVIERPLISGLTLFAGVILMELYVGITLIPQAYVSVRESITSARTTIHNFGLYFYVLAQWARLKVSSLLRVFLIVRMSIFITYAVVLYFDIENGGVSLPPLWDMCHRLTLCVQYILVRSCETAMAVIGASSVVSMVGQIVMTAFQSFLGLINNRGHPNAIEDEDEPNASALTAILFLLLALQTGLTGLSPAKRLAKLHRNFWLLSMAMLHFVHFIVNKVLLRLSTSGTHRWSAHVRALCVCALLLTAPWALIIFIWARDELWNPWLISVALFGMEVVIKTLVSLTVYVMFLWDTRRQALGDQLDEYIFWVRGLGSALEFVCSILLLCNGVYILIFEQTGVLRSLMICIHAYCNIWMQASEGWNSFKRRRQASMRLDQLQAAPAIRVENSEDVCSICYSELSLGAKLTACDHVFHRGCLKKWLYIHDRCPMCHRSVFTGLPIQETRS